MQANELFTQPNTILLDGGMGTMLQLSLIHISEPTRRTPISYAVFCLKKKKKKKNKTKYNDREMKNNKKK